MKIFKICWVLFITAMAIACITGCSKTATTTNNPPPIPPVDTPVLSNDPDTIIYTAGTVSTYSNHFAAYWNNKQLVQLSDGESSTCCITIVDTNVYVAGIGADGSAGYWKNGVYNSFYHGYFSEKTTDICSNGQDVYISGTGIISMTRVAEYWKNDQLIIMQPDFDVAAANGIAVSGSDVYLVGYAYNYVGLKSQAMLWKNGTAIPLTDGTHFAQATGIFIQGGDVYISGQETDYNDSVYVAKYWKNGQAVIISDSTSGYFTNSIFVDQNNVYVAGFQLPGTTLNPTGKDIATYWKNGVETKLFPGNETDAYAYTILPWGSDLYLTYNIYNNLVDSTTSPRYLKNQTPQLVDMGSFLRGDVKDIFIKTKH